MDDTRTPIDHQGLEVIGPEDVDRVILDMLAPWDCIPAVAGRLVPGGVLCCYVATATQLGRTADTLRTHGGFTEPSASELTLRQWHAEGLAIRPGHATTGHTGFLVFTRRLAPGVTPPVRKRRPGKGYEGLEDSEGRPAEVMPGANAEEWTPEAIGERIPSDKRVRKVRRSVTG